MSETMGRCRSEMTAAYGARGFKPNDSDLVTADALDRLAADVAAVKAAVCGRSGWPVGWLIEVDRLNHRRQEAIALADAAQGEVERLKRDGIQAPDDLGVLQGARGLSERCKELASRIAMQKIEARAEKLLAESSQQQPPAAPQPAAPAAGWLKERERRAVAYFAEVCRDDLVPDEWTDNAGVLRSILARAAPQPAAPPAGWLTERERHVLSSMLSERPCDSSLHWADDVQPVFRSILARAGSPPVVEGGAA